MSNMRVTAGAISYNSLRNIQMDASRVAKLQQQLSSGNQITTPSDDPLGTVRAIQLRGELARNAQYKTGADDAIGWMSTADTTYSQVVSTLQSARNLVLQGLNTGTNDATANDAIAQQLDAARASLLSLANTTYNGRPIFGGTTAGGVAYAADGSYVGDTGEVTRAVGPNSTVTVSATGPAVFGSGGTDVFAMLQNIADTLRTNPGSPTLGTALASLDSAIGNVSSAQAVEGATYQRVQLAQTNGTTSATALQTELSGIQDTDLADLAVKVTAANTTYQAALQTTAQIGQLSLLDFLR